MIFILALSLGIENYLFRFLPYLFLHSLPLPAFLALLRLPFLLTKETILKHKWLLYLLIYGLLISIIQYYFFYQDNFLFSPVIRQSSSFFIGVSLSIFLKDLFSRISMEKLSTVVINSSLVFLGIGIIQKISNHSMGNQSFRISGLFSEPSYFGDYLVLIVAPFIIHQFLNTFRLSRLQFVITTFVLILWGLNIVFTQSGMTLFKLSTLIVCFIGLYPGFWKLKIFFILTAVGISWISIFQEKSYLHPFLDHARVIFNEPGYFFAIGSLYDRFYPIYFSIVNLPVGSGIFGHGFGGDYFEFRNIYPHYVHDEMLAMKPSLSFFNSMASKIIYYFGIFGFSWLIFQFFKCFKSNNYFIKICFLNILLTSFWGIANFSLPYFWFWLALLEKSLVLDTHRDNESCGASSATKN